MFPVARPRRLRKSSAIRDLLRETTLEAGDLVWPLFVTHGTGRADEVPSMPGVRRLSVDRLVDEVGPQREAGIRALILFGIPEQKDELGSPAWDDEAPVQRAVRELKRAFAADVAVLTDVCLCEYTTHGHCGVVREGRVLNDPTLELLGRVAVSHARAGADIVAPSDMMDGRVGAIRQALDEAGEPDVAILSYAAKYASAFYGPFRDAAGSTPQFGDRRSYQMDPANGEEALLEVGLDLEEGADLVLVKPALAYLDVLQRVKATYRVPTAAYNVSGEYAMLLAAAERGWLERERAVLEVLTAIRRAGADFILTYHAPEAARLLRAGR